MKPKCLWHDRDHAIHQTLDEVGLQRQRGPDGMRAIDGKRLIIAEGAGRTAMGIPDGDKLEITTLKEGGTEGGKLKLSAAGLLASRCLHPN